MQQIRDVDFDQRDREARILLLDEIVRLRHNLAMSKAEVGRRRGSPESQIDFESRSNWKVTTVASVARALGRTFRMQLVGFPEPQETIESIILDSITGRTPEDSDYIHLLQVKNRMIRVRFELGMSIRTLAGNETDSKTLSRWERSERDTWVSTMQGYARKMGGSLKLDISDSA